MSVIDEVSVMEEEEEVGSGLSQVRSSHRFCQNMSSKQEVRPFQAVSVPSWGGSDECY